MRTCRQHSELSRSMSQHHFYSGEYFCAHLSGQQVVSWESVMGTSASGSSKMQPNLHPRRLCRASAQALPDPCMAGQGPTAKAVLNLSWCGQHMERQRTSMVTFKVLYSIWYAYLSPASQRPFKLMANGYKKCCTIFLWLGVSAGFALLCPDSKLVMEQLSDKHKGNSPISFSTMLAICY